ncbi:cysteine-rich receptor-like protein kinase 10 [Bidens hawaiensis]|uniref:cysteine-rich receptor-like protein kinase 10 n=1 Tax=Bidens hawaiensis TaxID=980011 RepID=UPI00404B1C24
MGTNNGFGFYNSTSGHANAAALCRGDIDPESCRRCVDDATRKLIPLCHNSVEASGWYNFCFLKYSNRTSDYRTGVQATSYGYGANNVSNSSYDQWNLTVVKLLDALRPEAAKSGSLRKYASGNITAPGILWTIYAYMQCTPDLSTTECDECLARATVDSRLHGRSLSVAVFKPSCVLRYENYSFFNSTWYPPPLFSGPLFPYLHTKLSNHSPDGSDHEMEDDDRRDINFFDLSTIQVATNNFSAENKLGEDGFGPVYKGKLQDRKVIAVKRLSSNSRQGLREFKSEVQLIIKLQHKNLVRLLGYCIKGTERILIYEFMANNSLETFLFDHNKCKELDWAKRTNIVSGIAKGLRYLHEDSRLKIIHRDLKASNILLDSEMNSKISDFCTARIFGGNQMEANTNRIVGTYGYMAPEYAMGGFFSTKSDVYSFGVVLLEIVAGQRNNRFRLDDEPQNFLSTLKAWRLWKENKGERLIDRSLVQNVAIEEALRWINIVLLCVQEDPQDRPTMSTVVFMLESNWSSQLPMPSEPPMSFARFVSGFEAPLSYARFAAMDIEQFWSFPILYSISIKSLFYLKTLKVVSSTPSGVRFICKLGELRGNTIDFFLNSQQVKIWNVENIGCTKIFESINDIEHHLIINGFMPNYTCWYKHGESRIDGATTSVNLNDDECENNLNDDNLNEDNLHDKNLDDMFKDLENDIGDNDNVKLQHLFEGSEKPLFNGSENSILEAVLKLFNVKAKNRWSNTSFTELLVALHGLLPKDSPQWRNINSKYPEFGNEVRNIRFGLSSDGINPFGHGSSQHSTWPVLLCIYNLPPWLCMKRKYIMMSLLIQGPEQPGNNIDVYLSHLIDDLKTLWSFGVNVYDAYKREYFELRAMIFCTINDFPAYGNLSGYTTKGKKGCPVCEDETSSVYLKHSRKTVYMGHRRFLPTGHSYRNNKKDFNGNTETGRIPKKVDAYSRIENLNTVLGKRNSFKKGTIWKKGRSFGTYHTGEI